MPESPMPPLPYSTDPALGVGGTLRGEAADFVVDEIPAFDPSGHGEHLLLRVEKHDTSHDLLLQHLSKRLEVPRRDIGTAGIKDRRAVTRQFMTVPARAEQCLPRAESETIRILTATRHHHKLRTGQLRGNRFNVLLRGVSADLHQTAESIRRQIERNGVPNLFGPQRFGRDGSTLRQGLELLTQELPAGQQRSRNFQTRLYLSAVQAELFNQVLTARFRDGIARTVLLGDVMQVMASRGPFVVEDVRSEQDRFDRRETVIAGPMFGPKMLPTLGVAHQREQQVLADYQLASQHFERFGRLTRGTRRAFWAYPEDLEMTQEDSGLRFRFALPAGSYATIVLREFIKGEE